MQGPLKGYRWSTRSSYEYILGNYEDPQVVKQFCASLQPHSVFYDLGANIGFYSMLANRTISSGTIYSFEPQLIHRMVFEKHLSINKNKIIVNNINILPFAIADKEKEVIFSNNEKMQDGNTYINVSPAFKESKKTSLIKCFSIDELIEKGYKKPDLIKIDVEGAEYDVLVGAENTLKQYRPVILLATHNWHFPGVKEKCVSFLEQLGYTLQPTGLYNKQLAGLDDFWAIHPNSDPS